MKILILSTWFPYPCNQGSKIRAYHLIKALASEHRLALISFEDQPIQPEWIEHIGEYCEEVKILPQAPFQYQRWKSLLGFFSLKPSAVYAGYSKEMENLVTSVAADWQPDLVFALTFVTAPYALKVPGVKRVVDMDNLLALMLKEEIPMSKSISQRMRRTLAYLKFRYYEDKIYSPFDYCIAVSDMDTNRVQQYTRIQPQQVICVPNGVDLNYYQINGIAKNQHELVYSGALTYLPNFDAMQFFLSEIFPMVQSEYPQSKLKITGKTNGFSTEHLRLNGNTFFTGYVDDIRPVVAEAEICIVPLRQGAGTRLKILEAMALGTSVVSTTKGAEGLDVRHGYDYLLADTPQEFAQSVIRLLKDQNLQKKLTLQARKTVEKTYNWEKIGAHFLEKVNLLSPQQDKNL
jgi:glycosyltransferase involved in cell wall biosynthesis